MLLRNGDGKKWLIVSGCTKFLYQLNGSSDHQVAVLKGTTETLLSNLASEAAARTAMDKIAGAVQSSVDVQQFVETTGGDWINVSVGQKFDVFDSGGTHYVRLDGNSLSSHASEAAAIAALDALAYSLGGVDAVELTS